MTGILAAAGVIALGLIVFGVFSERQARRHAETHVAPEAAESHSGSSGSVPVIGWVLAIPRVVRAHPLPLYGVVETLLWLGVLATLVDHLRDPANSLTAMVVWYLTIGVHELGHVICMPFGWLLHVAGGSIWQVLFWAGLGTWALFAQRRLTQALLLWAVAGHSFINLARYIDDARARELNLLFGLGPESHDWWNILSRYDLLEYDHLLADISTGIGTAIVLLTVVGGIVTTWLLPRVGLFGQARAFISWRTGHGDAVGMGRGGGWFSRRVARLGSMDRERRSAQVDAPAQAAMRRSQVIYA